MRKSEAVGVWDSEFNGVEGYMGAQKEGDDEFGGGTTRPPPTKPTKPSKP